MQIRAHVETIPPGISGNHETAVRDVNVEAATYEDGVAQVRAQLGDGERLITLRVSQAGDFPRR